jgi:hypothetical protein
VPFVQSEESIPDLHSEADALACRTEVHLLRFHIDATALLVKEDGGANQ